MGGSAGYRCSTYCKCLRPKESEQTVAGALIRTDWAEPVGPETHLAAPWHQLGSETKNRFFATINNFVNHSIDIFLAVRPLERGRL